MAVPATEGTDRGPTQGTLEARRGTLCQGCTVAGQGWLEGTAIGTANRGPTKGHSKPGVAHSAKGGPRLAKGGPRDSHARLEGTANRGPTKGHLTARHGTLCQGYPRGWPRVAQGTATQGQLTVALPRDT